MPIELPKNHDVDELEKLLKETQKENEKQCQEMRRLAQQHKEWRQKAEENVQLRDELQQMKILVEKYENSRTLVHENCEKDENQDQIGKLKTELSALRKQISSSSKNVHGEQKSNSFEQRRILDLERQVKELGLPNFFEYYFV